VNVVKGSEHGVVPLRKVLQEEGVVVEGLGLLKWHDDAGAHHEEHRLPDSVAVHEGVGVGKGVEVEE